MKRKTDPNKKKNFIRSTLYDLLFGVTVATIIRWGIFTPYVIPTSSMEGSLLAGDFIIVSKVNYGPRLPITPLQIPLSDKYIWFTTTKSYLDWIQLPYLRIPGFQDIKNNDVIVFNFPYEVQEPTPGNPFPADHIDPEKAKVPADLKTSYIKRCIAIAGDSIAIRNQVVYINGELLPNPPNVQFSYQIFTSQMLGERLFRRYTIPLSEVRQNLNGYVAHIAPSKASQLAQLQFIDSVKPIIRQDPALGNQNWTADNFGSFYIPKKGDTMTITDQNFQLYKTALLYYEGHKNITFKAGNLYIDGEKAEPYTFKYNYYFAMGDNRHNSYDSRFWGIIPENHIFGKGFIIWFSKNPELNLIDGIRWSRIFSLIK